MPNWMLRSRKLVAIASRPGYWRDFGRFRVAPAVEFEDFPLRADLRTVLDVGANRGQFSLMARHCFPSARIIAFEPVPSAAEAYRRLLPTAEMHQLALGAEHGEAEISVGRRTDHSSFVYAVGGGVPLRVPVRTLDELALDFERPALLKIDVQGYEPQVIAGAAQTLARIDQVLVEVALGEGRPGNDVLDSILAAGFRLEGVRQQKDVRHCDVLLGRFDR